MSALGHARGDGRREADRTARRLGFDGAQDLEDRVPWKVYIGINGLCVELLIRTDNEAVIGVHIASLVNSMVARA